MSQDTLTMPNFSRYFDAAVRRLHLEGLTPFTMREMNTVGWMCGQLKEDGHDHPIAQRVADEIDDNRLPKWVQLICWMSPFGLCTAHPQLLLRIARYLIGETTLAEEQAVPSEISGLVE